MTDRELALVRSLHAQAEAQLRLLEVLLGDAGPVQTSAPAALEASGGGSGCPACGVTERQRPIGRVVDGIQKIFCRGCGHNYERTDGQAQELDARSS